MRTALVFCGGGPSQLPIAVPDAPLVIAADVGAVEARRLGFAVDLLVGDMDSVPPGLVEELESRGVRVQRHPADKDATDLELALEAALAEGVERTLVVGGGGGRMDQLVGNALVMSARRFEPMRLDAVFGPAQVHVVRGQRELIGVPGETVSLFAVGGPARGVHASGLRWPLEGAVLEPGSSRGISNEFSHGTARLAVEDGVLLAIRPGRVRDEGAPS